MKYTLILFLGILLSAFGGIAQTPNQSIPYSYSFYQKLNESVYDRKTRFHSAIRDFNSDDSLLRQRYTELINAGTDTLNRRSWVRRKLTEEHLVNFTGDDYRIYADFLPDLQIGRDFNGKNTWLNTRGFQIGGNVGEKFSFYTSGFENQAVFANYITRYIGDNQVIPGQMRDTLSANGQDWAYVTALLSYSPNKHLNFALGHDKNFIGDGYRSMLLSDVAANYSFFRVRAMIGNVTYQTIFAYMLDPGAPKLTNDRRLGDRGKWAAMHYLDWNITNRFSAGFFQAVTWADAQPEGKRGFDFNYIHPFVFLRPLEGGNSTSPDKMRIGLNLKYEVFDKTALYGQFMFDEFIADEIFSNNSHWANKWALQLGFRGYDLFKVKSLNYLAEFNTARPYTYAHFDRLSNYGAMNQPLAHLYGANFREVLGIVNYTYKRFDLQGQVTYARYGLDAPGTNYGKDIFKSYDTRTKENDVFIGQGIGTNLYYAEAKVAYMLNPKYNLRIELGGVFRREASDLHRDNTTLINVGLRSSFRNFYQDF